MRRFTAHTLVPTTEAEDEAASAALVVVGVLEATVELPVKSSPTPRYLRRKGGVCVCVCVKEIIWVMIELGMYLCCWPCIEIRKWQIKTC